MKIGHLFGYNYFVAVFHLMRFESAIQVLFVASNFSEILTESPCMFSNRKDNTYVIINRHLQVLQCYLIVSDYNFYISPVILLSVTILLYRENN